MPDLREVLLNCFGPDSENNFTPTTEQEEVEQTAEHYEISTTAEEVDESPEINQPVRDATEGPKVDEVYPDFDTLFSFYQEHAKRRGFAVIKRSASYRSTGLYRALYCDRSGAPNDSKRTKKTGCKAHVNARQEVDGTWIVKTVVEEHNGHELTPDLSYLMRAHRSISNRFKRQLINNDKAGLRVCKNIRLAEVQCGGPENTGFTPRDARNYINAVRRKEVWQGDANAMVETFERLKLRTLGGFHYSINFDSADGTLKNAMWIDARSRAAYEEFNDAVSFDTTYLVNKYHMPFGTFVGINHHGQSILLGCALLANEQTDTLKWLFEHWLQAMGNVQPKCIITDQAEQIAKAIEEVMPNTVHRYCLWHITQKLPVKFKGQRDELKCALRRIIYESIDPGTFERKFNDFVTTYGLERNKWIKAMWNIRDKWVPCFSKDQFWGGMQSTQRSEGMHAFFDGFINCRSTLTAFIKQYHAALDKKVQNEKAAELASKTVALPKYTHYSWEEQFRSAYTNRVYQKFEDQVKRVMCCDVASKDFDPETGVETIKVREDKPQDMISLNEFVFTVQWKEEGEHLFCNCKKFEFEGIFCCHILKVMQNKDIKRANERYILRRWRKDVVRRYTRIDYKLENPDETPRNKMYRICENLFQDAASVCLESDSDMDYLKQSLEEILAQATQRQAKAATNKAGASASRTAPGADDNSVSNAGVGNPKVTKRRGRPREICYKPRGSTSGKTRKTGTNSGRGGVLHPTQ